MADTSTDSPGAQQSAWTLEDIRQAAARALGITDWNLPDDADLLENGMDSLRLMRLAGALRKAGYDIPLPMLAQHPTVAAWFELLDHHRGAQS